MVDWSTEGYSQSFERAWAYALGRLEVELPPGLCYHSVAHTRDDVVPAVETLARMEGIQGESLLLLRTAAWFHDLGFIEQRQGHEMISARLAAEALPDFGFSEADVEVVSGIIMATVLPQSPGSILEKIMADGDLDMLGRADFPTLNQRLRRELSYFGKAYTDREWLSGQLEFLQGHTYFTAAGRALRDAGKRKNVAVLQAALV